MPQPHTRDPYAGWRELTLRGMILGALITVVFTASNVYLGLKVGPDFRHVDSGRSDFDGGFKILQRQQYSGKQYGADAGFGGGHAFNDYLRAARTADGGLLERFSVWQTTLLCVSGGILGVIFTVPLRYAMVVKSSLPYPEGVAAAEILKVGSGEHEDAEQGQSGDSGVRESCRAGCWPD